jgi:hypothetical protein
MVVAGSRPIPVGDQTPWIRARTDAGNTFGSLSNHASVSWTAKCCRKREPPTRRSNSVLAQAHLASGLKFDGSVRPARYKSRRPITAIRRPESRSLLARWAKLFRYSELPESVPVRCQPDARVSDQASALETRIARAPYDPRQKARTSQDGCGLAGENEPAE